MKKIFYLIIIAASTNLFMLNAQSGSALTRIGAGDVEYNFSARKLGMGLLGVSVADPDHINTINPAGYSRLSRTRFEINSRYSGLFLENNDKKAFASDFDFQGVIFAFPISTDNGVSFAVGMLPYTNVSYKVNQDVETSSPIAQEYDIIYEGKGGFSKIFLGSSYRFPFDLTVGANFEYYFGNLNYFSRTNFVNPAVLDAEYKRTYASKGVGTTIGLISPDIAELFNSSVISNFRFGLSFNYIGNFKTDTTYVSTTSIQIDTLGEGRTNMHLPMGITAGMSMILGSRFLITLDLMKQNWSSFELESRDASGLFLRNLTKISAGFEYRPHRELGSTFFQEIIWRLGGSYEQTQYQVRGTGINQFSVSGGFSLPLGQESYIDIGLQYNMRGTKDNSMFKENSVRLGVGLNIGETWFIRQEK